MTKRFMYGLLDTSKTVKEVFHQNRPWEHRALFLSLSLSLSLFFFFFFFFFSLTLSLLWHLKHTHTHTHTKKKNKKKRSYRYAHDKNLCFLNSSFFCFFFSFPSPKDPEAHFRTHCSKSECALEQIGVFLLHSQAFQLVLGLPTLYEKKKYIYIYN